MINKKRSKSAPPKLCIKKIKFGNIYIHYIRPKYVAKIELLYAKDNIDKLYNKNININCLNFINYYFIN